MNTKITPSEHGSHLPADSRSPTFKRSRDPQSKTNELASPAKDSLTIQAPPSRFAAAEEPANTEVVNAISLSQTQEGFLQIVQKALGRMSELSAFCSDAEKPRPELEHYASEFTQLQNFISDVGTKKFNGVALFSDQALDITAKPDEPPVPLNAIDFNAPTACGGLANAYDPRSTEVNNSISASVALANIRKAIENLGTMQAKVGANLQRLTLSREQLSVLNANLTAAHNQVQDLEQVRSLAQFARFKILGQSGAAMMAQANTLPQTALRLLD